MTWTAHKLNSTQKKTRLVDAAGRRHGSLDGQASNVLPALLEQGDKVVDGQHDVGNQLLLVHVDVTDGDTHAQNLLELELDGGLDLGDLVGQRLRVRDGRGELAGLGQTRTQDTGNGLDQGLRGNEGVVLAGKLLDELLVLVELLQIISRHGIDSAVLGTVNVVLVTQNADGHVGAGDRRQADGARETLVTLGVIVLEADLELDGLEEVTLLGLVRVLEDLDDVGTGGGRRVRNLIFESRTMSSFHRLSSNLPHSGDGDLRHFDRLPIENRKI